MKQLPTVMILIFGVLGGVLVHGQTPTPSPEALAREGRYREASDAWYSLVNTQVGRPAILALDNALRFDPDLELAIKNLTTIGSSHKDSTVRVAAYQHLTDLSLLVAKPQDALLAIEQGLQIQPSAWELRYKYMSILILQGRFPELRDALEATLKLGPPTEKLPGFALMMTHWLASQKRYTEAWDVFNNQVLPGNKEPETLVFGIWLGLQIQNTPGTQSLLSLAQTLHGKHPAILAASQRDFYHIDPLYRVLGPIPTMEIPETRISTTATTSPRIQIGLFSREENANALVAAVQAKSRVYQPFKAREEGVWKVYTIIPQGKTPRTALLELKDLGFDGFLVEN